MFKEKYLLGRGHENVLNRLQIGNGLNILMNQSPFKINETEITREQLQAFAVCLGIAIPTREVLEASSSDLRATGDALRSLSIFVGKNIAGTIVTVDNLATTIAYIENLADENILGSGKRATDNLNIYDRIRLAVLKKRMKDFENSHTMGTESIRSGGRWYVYHPVQADKRWYETEKELLLPRRVNQSGLKDSPYTIHFNDVPGMYEDHDENTFIEARRCRDSNGRPRIMLVIISHNEEKSKQRIKRVIRTVSTKSIDASVVAFEKRFRTSGKDVIKYLKFEWSNMNSNGICIKEVEPGKNS